MTQLSKNRIEKIGVLRHKIRLCKRYKCEVISNVSHLNSLFWSGKLPEHIYRERLNEYLQGKALNDWVGHYDSLIENFNQEIKAIGKSQTWLNNSLLLIGFLLLVIALLSINSKYPVEKQDITAFATVKSNEPFDGEKQPRYSIEGIGENKTPEEHANAALLTP